MNDCFLQQCVCGGYAQESSQQLMMNEGLVFIQNVMLRQDAQVSTLVYESESLNERTRSEVKK